MSSNALSKRWLLLSLLVQIVIICRPACAHDDLAMESARLEERLRVLEGDVSVDSRRSEAIRSLIAGVLADAESRSTLVSASAHAGWDDGFFIASGDRSYLMRIGMLIQPRFVLTRQGGGDDGTRYGFENARTRLILRGHFFDPDLTYRIQGQFSRSAGTLVLEDAFVRWEIADNWELTVGQFRIPLLREILIARSRQQLVERSLIQAEFTAGRTRGVSLEHRADRWRLTSAFTDGMASTGGFNVPALAANVDYALGGRVEHRVAGTWDQFEDYTSWPDDELGLILGAATHYQSGEDDAAHEGDVMVWTVDASAAFGGANLFAYVTGRQLRDPGAGARLNQLGAVVQGGLLIADGWEVFARYEWGDSDLNEPNLSLITAGVTRFFARHRLKWTSDVGYGLRPVAPTWGSGMLGTGGNLAGWRTDNDGRSGQIVVRTQLQLWF